MIRNTVKPEEYNPYYGAYIEQVAPHTALIEGLEDGAIFIENFFKNLPEDRLQYRYDDGKWTPKEILLHLIDAERVFSYRALRFARQDQTSIPGFDQDDYVAYGNANDRSLSSLLTEYKSVRKATIALFRSMTHDQLIATGTASTSVMSVRAAGFIVCGHERHHIAIIKERYLKE